MVPQIWTIALAVLGAFLASSPLRAQTSPSPPSLPSFPSVQYSSSLPNQPLHERIDLLIEASAIGPLAPTCSDADFVRRIHLDLTGVIPSASAARAFVADTSADKRQRLIDELLASPAFLRHMTIALDVMLMERKPEKVVKQPEWEEHLYKSLADDKPLDRLFLELVAADGAEEKLRPAARFVLDRDAEPNLLTRDIGRLVFGMDLQCCQCHDHPLIDDYYQDDYYGLFAFVHRTALFTDAKTKQISLTEKADGEASFKSVFTGASSDKAQPRLPKGVVLFAEPSFAKGEEYSIKPDKTIRGVPRFSRRTTLAQMIPSSREFARNLANRLWAQVFGRGIVHPVDFHHAANPPTHPELLSLLTEELAAGALSAFAPRKHALPTNSQVANSSGFQLRPFLRELVLTRAYQRSCDTPRPDTINFADVAARLAQLTRDKESRKQSIQPFQESLTAAKAAFKSAKDEDAKVAAQLTKLAADVATAEQEMEKLAAERKLAEKARTVARQQIATVQEAAEKLAELAASLPDDKVLTTAATAVRERATDLSAAAESATKFFNQQSATEESAAKRLADAQQSLALATAARPTTNVLQELERAQLHAEHELSDARFGAESLDSQIATAQAIIDYRTLAATEPTKAEAAWAALIERWTIRCQIAPLKPLTPEQLAASAMQATGMLTPQLAAVEAKLDKEAGKVATAGLPSSDDRSRLVQLELLNQLRTNFREFIRQYGGQPGEEFQATVNQALFFGNGTIVDAWLKPSSNNLVDELDKQSDTGQLTDDLYWSVFSRPATPQEQHAVADYLKPRSTDKPIALAELAWALLSSTEFRFNH